MIKSVVWSSSLDYPNQVSTILFVGACNWDCLYCQNKPLFNMECLNIDNIINKLESRKEWIGHVVISGGEPTVWDGLLPLIKELKGRGFTIGLHTNGSKPEVLRSIIQYISFIGMDIKSSKENWSSVANIDKIDSGSLLESIKLIADSGIDYEFRTTIDEEVNTIEDCGKIVDLLIGLNISNWIIQRFISDNMKTDKKSCKVSYLEEIKRIFINKINIVIK